MNQTEETITVEEETEEQPCCCLQYIGDNDQCPIHPYMGGAE